MSLTEDRVPGDDRERSPSFQLTLDSSHPQLLSGLDALLRLGLIEEERVKQIGRIYLSRPLPTPQETVQRTQPTLEKVAIVSPETRSDETPSLSILGRAWESFKQELSVRLLLFLGVFLVVVSSGVLAATQWERFPPAGQYGVLGAYTFAFWLVGRQAARQETLQLTAKTLQTIFLLLVPLNFWALDTFGLRQSLLGQLTLAVATIVLSALTYTRQQDISPTRLLCYLALSYLHLIWGVAGGLAALYVGVVAGGIALIGRYPRNRISGSAYLLHGVGILVIRATFIELLPAETTGLAIASLGFLLTDFGHQQRDGLGDRGESHGPLLRVWEGFGVSLLLLGWIFGLQNTYPWQAIIAGGLGLGYLSRSLVRDWRRWQVAALFFFGLQEVILFWVLLPQAWRNHLIDPLARLTDTESFPGLLASVLLQVYLVVALARIEWLYRRDRSSLARFAGWLTLGFGCILTLSSLLSPGLRTINLFISTAALVFVVLRRPNPILIYFTHLVGLFSIYGGVDWILPEPEIEVWAGISLVLLLLEWEASLRFEAFPHWRSSCWYYGLGLATLSYIFLLEESLGEPWGLLWLSVPLALTRVAHRDRSRRQETAWLATVTLILAQVLVISLPGARIASLGIATGLMLVNVRYLQALPAAAVHVGFGLAWLVAILWKPVNGSNWWIVSGFSIIALWSLYHWFGVRGTWIGGLYQQACDRFGGVLMLSELAALSGFHLAFAPLVRNLQVTIACLLIGGAIAVRYSGAWNNFAVICAGWTGELLLLTAVGLAGGDRLDSAIANIVVDLLLLVLTEWLLQRRGLSLWSLKYLPLFYALLGMVLRWDIIEAYTGLLTLGASIAGIWVGQRSAGDRWLVYISLGGLTASWYELVWYRLSPLSGEQIADTLTILAALAAVIAVIYRCLAWFWFSRHEKALLQLSENEIVLTAHIHWTIAAGLLIGAIAGSLNANPQLTPLAITLELILAIYAWIEGRGERPGIWIYLGFICLAALGIHARAVWTNLKIIAPWVGGISSAIALLIYPLPWPGWGWQAQPWQWSLLSVPVGSIIVTAEVVATPSLWMGAIAYVMFARWRRNWRWTYLTVAFVEWALWRHLEIWQLQSAFLAAVLTGVFILYIARVDPFLSGERSQRHLWRCIGTGIICISAFYFYSDPGWTPAGASFLFILFGIGLQVRAYLFIGLAVFLATIFNQALLLVRDYSFFKWIIGLVLGIALIAIAANFERRREQLYTIIRHWFEQFRSWE